MADDGYGQRGDSATTRILRGKPASVGARWACCPPVYAAVHARTLPGKDQRTLYATFGVIRIMEIIQIVPSFPPAVSGVGDYALLLANELRKAHNLHTRFIVGDSDWAGSPEADGFS